MRSLLSTVAVVASAAAAASLIALPSGSGVLADTWCNNRPANESFCVTGTEAGDWVDIVMTAPATVGWVAFGIGENHKDADMIVAWLADGVTIVSPRYSTDYVEPAYDSAVLANQQIIIFPDSRALNGTFRVHLQRRKVALTDKDKPLFPGPQTYMYAMQTQDEYSPKSTDYQAHIMRHDVFGVIPQFSLFSTTPKKSSIFTPEWYAKKTTITAHGWIMFISWGIIAPLWAFTARYVKGTSAMWDRAHYYSHLILVGFMTLIAVPIAIYAVTPGKQFDDAHSIIGLIVFVIMFVEIGLNAYLYFMAPATSVTVSSKTAELGDDLAGSAGRAGRTVRLAHTITLSILLVLAWIALGTGIKQFGVRYGDNGLITASLAIYAIYIVLLVAGLIFIGERYMKRTQKLPEINMGTIQDFTDTLNRKVEAAVSSLKGSAEAAATSKKYPTGAAGSDVLGYEADDQVLVNKSPYTQLED